MEKAMFKISNEISQSIDEMVGEIIEKVEKEQSEYMDKPIQDEVKESCCEALIRKLRKRENKSNNLEWTDEIVYSVFKNENLKDLPIRVLVQMRNHIEDIIDSKLEVINDKNSRR